MKRNITDIELLDIGDGVSYTGGGSWCAFGVCTFTDSVGCYCQRFFQTGFEGGFSEVQMFYDFPYILEGDAYPSYMPKDDFDGYCGEVLLDTDPELYDFWKALLQASAKKQCYYPPEWDNLLAEQEAKLYGTEPKTIKECFDKSCSFWMTLFNRAMVKAGAPDKQIFTADTLKDYCFLHYSFMDMLKVVRGAEFDTDKAYHYFDEHGMLVSTDCPETIPSFDGLMDAL